MTFNPLQAQDLSTRRVDGVRPTADIVRSDSRLLIDNGPRRIELGNGAAPAKHYNPFPSLDRPGGDHRYPLK